jgi:hypothetical protein
VYCLNYDWPKAYEVLGTIMTAAQEGEKLGFFLI